MRVKVLYFGALTQFVSASETCLSLPEGVTTVEQFTRWLPTMVPAFEGRLASVRIARNEAFAAGEELLAEGDVLALIPPVAGG